MKIMHLSYSDKQGGAAKAAHRIHTSLNNAGVDSLMFVFKKLSDDPTVLTYPDSNIIINKVIARIDNIPRRFKSGIAGKCYSPAWVGTRFPDKLIKKFDPDVIHLHWICGGFMRIESLPLIKKPIVWRLPDMWSFCGGDHYPDDERYKAGYDAPYVTNDFFDVDKWIWRRKKKAYSKLKNLTIVTPSKWLTGCAQESALFKNRTCLCIPTGHNTRLFQPKDKTKLRQSLNIPGDQKLIMFCGENATNDPRKGYAYLHEALCKLHREGKLQNCIAIIVGGEIDTEEKKLPIPTRCYKHVLQEKLADMYAMSDVVVVPSIMENLPNTAIEALSCGIPVVAFASGGIPDVVIHETTGFLAENKNSDSLALGIHSCLTTSRYTELSNNARALITGEYSVEVQAKNYIKLYESIISRQI